MRIHALYQVAYEGPGFIADWAKENGHALNGSHVYQNEKLPFVDEFDLLVVMGGPMNIYDEDQYPWLQQEKVFIRQAIDAEKLVLGICLGAQLIAEVLNGRVIRNRYKEIGWFPVFFRKDVPDPFHKDLPDEIMTFHWHGDTFDLPPGAVRLAGSDATTNQAFLYGERILGIQFHPEVRPQDIVQMINGAGDDLKKSRYVQTASEMKNISGHYEKNNALLTLWLNKLEYRISNK